MNAGSVGDTWSTVIVVGVIVALVALGVALITLTVWVVRATRVDAEALVGLEEMGTRRWRRADLAERRQLLDGAKAGADHSLMEISERASESLSSTVAEPVVAERTIVEPMESIDPLTRPEPVGE